MLLVNSYLSWMLDIKGILLLGSVVALNEHLVAKFMGNIPSECILS